MSAFEYILGLVPPHWMNFGLTFIFCLLSSFQIPPFGAHESAQLSEGEIRVSGFNKRPHLTAKQDVATHVDLTLGAFLLRHALYLWCGLKRVCSQVKTF